MKEKTLNLLSCFFAVTWDTVLPCFIISYNFSQHTYWRLESPPNMIHNGLVPLFDDLVLMIGLIAGILLYFTFYLWSPQRLLDILEKYYIIGFNLLTNRQITYPDIMPTVTLQDEPGVVSLIHGPVKTWVCARWYKNTWRKRTCLPQMYQVPDLSGPWNLEETIQ